MLHGLAMMHSALLQLGHPGLIVRVFDMDVVQQHNVGRQRYAWPDVGLNKAQALVAEVNRAYQLDWHGSGSAFDINDPLSKKPGNIVITCVDSGRFRWEFNKLFKKIAITETVRAIQDEHEGLMNAHYWLDTGNSKDFGQVVLGGNGLPTCVDLQPKEYRKRDPKDQPTCSMADSLKHQDLFINQYVATVALDMLWNLFRRGCVKRPQVYININQDRYAVRATKIKSHEDHSDRQKTHLHAQGEHRSGNDGQRRRTGVRQGRQVHR